MASVEVLYYPQDVLDSRADPARDLGEVRPVGVAVSSLKFQLYYCLVDFAFEVAKIEPRLQGSVQEVDVGWRREGQVLVPVLRIRGSRRPEIAYPLQALRGGEVVPEALQKGTNGQLRYVVRPMEDDRSEGGSGFGLEPVGADGGARDPDALTAAIPVIPGGPEISLPRAMLGASFHWDGDPPVILPWGQLRYWALEVGARLRSGWAFEEEGLLGAGMAYASPNLGVINSVTALLPARETQVTAGSISFTPASYRHHENEMERLSALNHSPIPLTLSVWAHTHKFETTCAKPETECALRREGEDGDSPVCSRNGLIFSSMDVGVQKATYPDPWAAGVVLDAAAARMVEPTIEGADRMFAVYGWRRGMVVRRSAYLDSGPPERRA